MKKNFFAAALILSLGVGSFAACSSDDVPVNPTEQKKTTTMMSIALKMPAASGQRAATDEPYNYIGEWLGQEKVKNVKVYIFDTGSGNREVNPVLFNAATNDFSASLVGTDFLIRPNKGIEVAQGPKKVYVVVNSNTLTDNLLDSHTTLAAFENAYKSDGLTFAGAGVGTSTSPQTAVAGVASEVAELDKNSSTNPSDWKNVIVMTGEAATGTIADGVSETTAISGAQNQVAVTVKRLVAPAAVTSSAASFTLSEDDPYNHGTNVNIGTVSGFTYVAAQSERKVNFLQASDAAKTSDDGLGHSYNWNSPALSFISDANYALAGGPGTNSADARAKYDYAPLWKGDAATNLLLGTPVATNASLALAAGNPNAEAIGKLMEGDFLLPTTHKWGNTATASEYKKGNTAYLLIRTIFQPNKINIDNDATGAGASRPGTVKSPVDFTYNAITSTTKAGVPVTGGDLPEQLVRGANGMFYSTVWASQDPMYNGVNGQAVEIFNALKNSSGKVIGYKMIYFAWVNPDKVDPTGTGKWLNSPVYRNNIYHVQLDGVGGTGLSWNPLIPGDNTTPNTTTPNNPDPQTPPTSVTIPNYPPVTPPNIPTPVTPQNPLTPDKTFMSVKTTVLPWQVHGYKFKLQNQ